MKLTSTQFIELQKCNSPQEVVEKAKTQGLELTLQEAETVLAKSSAIELDENSLASVTGGNVFADHVSYVYCNNCGERAKYTSTINLKKFIMHCYVCDCGYETTYHGDEYQYCKEIPYPFY